MWRICAYDSILVLFVWFKLLLWLWDSETLSNSNSSFVAARIKMTDSTRMTFCYLMTTLPWLQSWRGELRSVQRDLRQNQRVGGQANKGAPKEVATKMQQRQTNRLPRKRLPTLANGSLHTNNLLKLVACRIKNRIVAGTWHYCNL